MDGTHSLSRGFLDAMEKDFQAELDELEAASRGRISELIGRARNETTEAVERRREDFRREAERLAVRRSRALRALNGARQKKFEELRLARLEESVCRELEIFRRSEGYGEFLAGMAEQCRRAGFCGRGIIEAEEPEAALLESRFEGCTVVKKTLGGWGGFVLIEEGGALFDCTFRTRWRQYCRELPFGVRARG